MNNEQHKIITRKPALQLNADLRSERKKRAAQFAPLLKHLPFKVPKENIKF